MCFRAVDPSHPLGMMGELSDVSPTVRRGLVVLRQNARLSRERPGLEFQLTAVSRDLRQATLPTCVTWSGSEGYCMVE